MKRGVSASAKAKGAAKRPATPSVRSREGSRRAGKAECPPGLAPGSLAAHLCDGVVVVGPRKMVRFINPAAERLLGTAPGKYVGKRWPFSLDASRPLEETVSGGGLEASVVEILTAEVKQGRERFYILGLRDVTTHVRMREQLRALSDVDPLTGLLNRRGFFDAVNRQLGVARRSNREMTLFFLDLDNLKRINDTQGHLEGDQALAHVANILRKTFRQPDILSRFGGDEFAVLAIEAKQKSARRILGRLRKNLEDYNAHTRAAKRLSFSVGLAQFNPKKPSSLETLIEMADLHMYREKVTKRRR